MGKFLSEHTKNNDLVRRGGLTTAQARVSLGSERAQGQTTETPGASVEENKE